MKTYTIRKIYDSDYRYCVETDRSNDKISSSIYLPKNEVTSELKSGDKITVLRDSYFDVEDLVYLYKNGISFAQSVPSSDEYTCRLYVKNIQGLWDHGKLDRIAFKFALIKECRRCGKTPSLIAWRNLQNLR